MTSFHFIYPSCGGLARVHLVIRLENSLYFWGVVVHM